MTEKKVFFNITHKVGCVTCTVFTPADDDGGALQELAEFEVNLKSHYWDGEFLENQSEWMAHEPPPFLGECARRIASVITGRPVFLERRQTCSSATTSKSACNPFE